MKKIGIWLDTREALIVDPSEGIVNRITSEVENYSPHGGSGGNVPYGPQDAVKDTQYLGRKNQQIKEYCEEIMELIDPNDKLVVLGPAEMKLELEKAIKSNPKYSEMLFEVKTVDSMTDNQLNSWVQDYFGEKDLKRF